MVNCFFDTYAMVEIILGNEDYQKYGEQPLVTTMFNRVELCWWALTRYDESLARMVLDSLRHIIEVPDEVLIEAMQFRKSNKKRNLSIPDSVGYIIAKRNRLVFLTGDEQFKDLPNVEFVK